MATKADEELRSQLQPGDLIIATQDRRFDKRFSPEQHYAQRVGDIIMVNNPNIGNLVGGTGINGTCHNGRKNIGLGSSFEVGTFRRATPDDPGYIATREQWHAELHTEIRRLRARVFLFACGLACSLITVFTLLANS